MPGPHACVTDVPGFSLGEVCGVSVGELAVLVLLSLPAGLLFGRGLALVIMARFTLVSRMLAKLDFVGFLKARD